MWDLMAKLFSAAGGLAGIAAVVHIIIQRRKINAETAKTGVDAAAVVTDSALDIMRAAQQDAAQTKADVTALRGEVRALRRHIMKLEDLLARHGITPPEFVWPAAGQNGNGSGPQ